MLFTQATIIASALASAAFAKTIPITVGKDDLLEFSPNSTTAAVGDVLEFKFYAKNHTVTQGPFSTPCLVNETAVQAFSGFIPTTGTGPNAEIFAVTVEALTPMWFFCSQNTPASHCSKGMVFVVNENATSTKTLAAYASGAASVKAATFPGDGKTVQVGKLSGTSNATSGTSTSSGSSSTSSTASSASGTTTKSSAASTDYSPMNMLAASVAALGALAFSVAL